MKAFNKKNKRKHTTKVKGFEVLGAFFTICKSSKAMSIADGIFGETCSKFKSYRFPVKA